MPRKGGINNPHHQPEPTAPASSAAEVPSPPGIARGGRREPSGASLRATSRVSTSMPSTSRRRGAVKGGKRTVDEAQLTSPHSRKSDFSDDESAVEPSKRSRKETAAQTRNRHRVKEADIQDRDLAGKHLPDRAGKSSQMSSKVLFLDDHCQDHDARSLVLWDAFLVCIRPQVLEWTNNMAIDMIRLDSFFDAPVIDHAGHDDPRTRNTPTQNLQWPR